jgi:hypothetical protein
MISSMENGADLSVVDDLVDARNAFVEALDDVEPELLTTPGMAGEWSARELIAHVGYWAGHATEAIHAVEQGRVEEFDADAPSVDERNDTVARVARETDLETVMRREEAAFNALADRLQAMDPALLNVVMSDGESLGALVREDGVDHYREHTLQVREWWAGGEPDDEAALEDLSELDGDGR